MPRGFRFAAIVCAALAGPALLAGVTAAPAAAREVKDTTTAPSGKEKVIYKAAYYNTSTCRTTGMPVFNGLKPPQHGKILTQQGPVFNDTQGHPCQGLYFFGLTVIYKSKPGFVGIDSTVFDVVNPDGTFERVSLTINVKR